MLFFSLLIVSNNAMSKQATALEFERCQVSKNSQSLDAQCAMLIRPEDPTKPDGKQLKLFVAKFPALQPDPELDAFTVIQGGPGASSIDLFIQLSPALQKIRKDRDVLVIDQRGTGRSHNLSCPESDQDEFAASLDTEVIKQLTQQCLDQLDGHGGMYTTSIAVQDLEALRESAAYPQLTIYGVSYGTRVAQHYLRRFPDKVRAMVLDGVVDLHANLAGGEIAIRSQQAFDGMLQDCAESAPCAEQFGDLGAKFASLRARLKDAPVEVEFLHPLTGQTLRKPFGEGHLLGVLRLMLYSTDQTAMLPIFIATAHAGDYTAIMSYSEMINESFAKSYAIGMNNSVVCAEDAPFVTEQDLLGIDQTYFGSIMADALQASCSVWPRGHMDEDFRQRFSSDRPVLLLSGETDPITPPANGDTTGAMLVNSKHLVVPAHGHGVIGVGCVPSLVAEFVATASFAGEGFNAACVERERAMPFFTDMTGPTP